MQTFFNVSLLFLGLKKRKMINIFLIVLALVGIGITIYIHHLKKTGKKPVCIIGKGCNTVIHSKYANILGLPLEVLGFIYYATVALLAILLSIGVLQISVFPISKVLLLLGTLALLFTIYLTYIQGAVLKMWCQYCLSSALVTFFIFLVELIPYYAGRF